MRRLKRTERPSVSMETHMDDRKRGVRRTAFILTLIVLVFYFGFIILTIHRAS
jgi:uncharacterized membrane protein (DUF485 family)